MTERKRRTIRIFRVADAREPLPEEMPREGIDEHARSALASLAEAGYVEGTGERNRMLFSEPGDNGMSLLHVWFKSGYVLPYHSHNVDCLYYVLGGELRIGSHRLQPGDGFFVPADQAYGYEAGPEGVEVLEFRNASRFNLALRGNTPQRWQQIVDVCRERAADWAGETEPPSER